MNRGMDIPLQYGVPVPGVDRKARDCGAGRDMRQVVTVRSQGTDDLLMQCTSGWSVGADDAVSSSGQHPQMTMRPRSRRRKRGCQDLHVVIHCVVLSGFAITSTLFMPDNHMMLVFITNH